MQPYMPLGTLYAATALREEGISVAVFDSMLAEPSSALVAMLEEHRPRIVAVYEDDFNFLSKMCLTRMREVAWDIAKAAQAIDAVTIVHGSDSTDNPKLFLENGFQYVLCGETEMTLVQLCSSLLRGEELPEMDGLARTDKSGTIVQSRQRLSKNPGWPELTFPARNLIDFDPYRAAWTKAHGYFSTNIVASRGCPYQCNWCAKPISGNKFNLRPAASVAEEMRVLKENFGVEHLWFSDDVFALNKSWMEDFAKEITKKNAAIPFKIQSRADLMGEKTVQHLKTAGCTEVWMGVESGSQTVLNAMDKGLSVESVISARQRLKEARIRACYFLQFGYPGEGLDELRETIALVRETRPDDIGISFSYPLPGTLFYEHVQAQLGWKRNWTDSDDLCIMFKAAYTTDFYRAVREALHAEVDSWKKDLREINNEIDSLWQRVEDLELINRNSDALLSSGQAVSFSSPALVSVEKLLSGGVS